MKPLIIPIFSLLAASAAASELAPRLEEVSRSHLGAPYLADPLGEGDGALYDTDPLFRFDGFDCTTFVETVIAETVATDSVSFKEHLTLIRYRDGVTGFWSRNHFPDADWVPNGERHSYFKDVTENVAQNDTLWAKALIDRPSWAARLNPPRIEAAKLEAMRAEGASLLEPVIASVPYVPLALVIESAEVRSRIPSGTVVNIVRPGWDLTETIGTHLNISHQGLLFWIDGQLILRHASPFAQGVVDVDFVTYLQGVVNSPTIRGVQLLEVLVK